MVGKYFGEVIVSLIFPTLLHSISLQLNIETLWCLFNNFLPTEMTPSVNNGGLQVISHLIDDLSR